ncbi:hypothetical protein ABZ686_04705 [Streptomyces sp. NPDC006992]|uniref:hypothetical protein n=1 Tax=unclassified Streptomyces TaxID=2593676 RepID=UPI0033E34FE2
MTDPEHYALAMAHRSAPSGDPEPAPERHAAAPRTGTEPDEKAPAPQHTAAPPRIGPLNPPT